MGGPSSGVGSASSTHVKPIRKFVATSIQLPQYRHVDRDASRQASSEEYWSGVCLRHDIEPRNASMLTQLTETGRLYSYLFNTFANTNTIVNLVTMPAIRSIPISSRPARWITASPDLPKYSTNAANPDREDSSKVFCGSSGGQDGKVWRLRNSCAATLHDA